VIYMLNLIFDVTEPNAVLNGRFQPYVAPQGATPDYLQCSKVWLKSPYGNNYDVSNEWTWMQEDTGAPLTLQGGEQGDQIVVRVLGLNTPTDNTNGNLTWLTRLTVVVSRDTPRAIKDNATPPKPYQTRASPFPMSGPLTEPCVLYDFETTPTRPGIMNYHLEPLPRPGSNRWDWPRLPPSSNPEPPSRKITSTHTP